MREGVDAAGRNLYPAFPYDHFRHLHDDDLAALYAFLMTREPVHAVPPGNDLRFPFNLRPLIGAWKALYLDDVPLPVDPARGTAWNRGAYLVAGHGHCGACHTPRNAAGAELRDRPLAGGETEGWHAPALDAHSPSPVPWDAASLATYLRTGIAPRHSIAGGPMAAVTRGLADVPEADVHAMAAYLASLQAPAATAQPGAPDTAPVDVHGDAAAASAPPSAPDTAPVEAHGDAVAGAHLYAAACAACHAAGRAAWPEGALDLRDWIAAAIPTSANLMHIVVDGIHPPPGGTGRWMPAFRGTFTRAQLVELAAYVRLTTGRVPWDDAPARAQDALAAPAAAA
jgi:mono/diheme cytochrome c family protein